jgi:hypothetical protein
MSKTRLAAFVALSLVLGACAGSRGSDNDLVATLADTHAHPEQRLDAEVACERAFSRRSGDFPFRAFSSGLLDVAEESGDRAFCTALVEAVIAGDLGRDDLRAFQRPMEIRGKAPLGKLLRAVIAAHERLHAAQAQKPPQAQSCGCGQ